MKECRGNDRDGEKFVDRKNKAKSNAERSDLNMYIRELTEVLEKPGDKLRQGLRGT